VAQGTIEHGMLQVLSFKKSLFAGVLDGGKDEVFFGGTRLKKFMESVEKVTSSIPEPMPAQAEPGPEEDGQGTDQAPTAVHTPVSQKQKPAPVVPATGSREQALADLAVAGGQFLEKLCGVLAAASAPATASGNSEQAGALVERDARTGRSYLRLPLPEPETLTRLVELIRVAAPKR
jgi:hypothetical protein